MNEDFVTFELAKKLKEKGFTCEIPFAMYNELGTFHLLATSAPYSSSGYKYRKYYDYDDFDAYDYTAPTISQVLKWLRKEKKISIQPLSVRGGTWEAQITFTDDNDVTLKKMFEDKSFWTDDRFTSYEQAAFAGIEYVIDNML